MDQEGLCGKGLQSLCIHLVGTVSHTGKNHVSKNTNTSNVSKTLEAAVSKRNVIGAMSVILYFPVDTLKKNSGINFHILKLTQYI